MNFMKMNRVNKSEGYQYMKVHFNIPWYYKLLTIIGCCMMSLGLAELYLRFLPDSVWKFTPFVCILVGVFLIIPQHFMALMEILKYRPKNDK